jgi:hypothetical protein
VIENKESAPKPVQDFIKVAMEVDGVDEAVLSWITQ